MILKKIKISNISSYSGTYELDFSIDGQRNVILIGGQNGAGKTSLFTAIKLALYGPLCFGFQSKNNQYTARIKDLISHDAFAASKVSAYTEIHFQISRDRSFVDYIMRREWEFADRKLKEVDSIWENDQPLDELEYDYFQNYLYSMIPPDLFEFFFFDGEEISNMFTSARNNSFIKNAVLKLEGYDTFALIEKYCKKYVVEQDDNSQREKLSLEFEEIVEQIEEYQANETTCQEQIHQGEKEINGLKTKAVELENQFRRAGGLSRLKRKEIQTEIGEQEKIKGDANKELRDFVDNAMPLILTKDIAWGLQNQLKMEEQIEQYQAIAGRLRPENLQKAAADVLERFHIKDTHAFAEHLSSAIIDSVKPDADIDFASYEFMHALSFEQKKQVFSALARIEQFDKDGIISAIQRKEESTREIARLKKTVDNSMDEAELKDFEDRLRQVQSELDNKTVEVAGLRTTLENCGLEKKRLEKRFAALRTQLSSLTRRIEAEQYTQPMARMMKELQTSLLRAKGNSMEEETLRISKVILRKENFIDLVELDDEFNLLLYKEQDFTYTELATLVSNTGYKGLISRIGQKGYQSLMEYFQVNTHRKLSKCLSQKDHQVTMYDKHVFHLYKRMDFQQLSKGEKQILILALYWAIIKQTNREVPFIIDTPFARIDVEHREQIATNIFPQISSQVIIFSTDEEISQRYYQSLQPYISQEYVLNFNEITGRTEISKGYFY